MNTPNPKNLLVAIKMSSPSLPSSKKEEKSPPPPTVGKPFTSEHGTFPSKRAAKRYAKELKWEARKKEDKQRKKEEKERKRKRREEEGREVWEAGGGEVQETEESKKEREEAGRRREEKRLVIQSSRRFSADSSFRCVIDCDWGRVLTDKEKKSLGKQIAYCYAFNRRQDSPVHLEVAGIKVREGWREALASAIFCCILLYSNISLPRFAPRRMTQ